MENSAHCGLSQQFYLLFLRFFCSDVVKAKISRPRPHPSRPSQGLDLRGQGLDLRGLGQGLDLRGQGQGDSPKAKAFKHTATTDIKICSTSDSLTG